MSELDAYQYDEIDRGTEGVAGRRSEEADVGSDLESLTTESDPVVAREDRGINQTGTHVEDPSTPPATSDDFPDE